MAYTWISSQLETEGNSKSTWTLSFSMGDFYVRSDEVSLPTLTLAAKYSAVGGKSRAWAVVDYTVTVNNVHVSGGSMGSSSTSLRDAWTANTNKTFTGTSGSFSTSDFFNSSNPTTRSVPVRLSGSSNLGSGSQATWGEGKYGRYIGNLTFGMDTYLNPLANAILDVPPTYVASVLHIDTTAIYSDITTVSVDVSDLTAYYGGYITSAELKIGNQTATLTGDATNVLSSGTLSILLDTAGTFTPTVTITDSRGQTATKTYASITVNSYDSPALSMNLERVDANGDTDDEGAYGLITATISYTNAIVKLLEPTVTIDGVATATTNWYTDRALTNLVDWADYNPASPVTIYGHFGGSFSTQSSYLIGVTPTDTHTDGTEITQTLATAFYTIDFRAGGHGIAFGQPSSQDGFFCNMDAHFVDANNMMRALFDFMYPIGSYYETSDTSFDPNVTWGGTWVKDSAGRVTVAQDTENTALDTIGETGGNKDAIVPYHNHGTTVTQPEFKISGGLFWMSRSDARVVNNACAETKNVTSGSQFFNSQNVGCARSTNVGVTVNYAGSSGNATNANLQPYVVVNRWHRTA